MFPRSELGEVTGRYYPLYFILDLFACICYIIDHIVSLNTSLNFIAIACNRSFIREKERIRVAALQAGARDVSIFDLPSGRIKKGNFDDGA